MPRPLLGLALALHVLFAASYAVTTPAFEAPDENCHYEYAWQLGNAGRLPLGAALAATRGLPQTEGAQLGHHPPLYYALLGGLLAATGTDDTVFGPRLNEQFGVPDAAGRHLKFQHGSGQGEVVLLLLRLVSVLLGAITVMLVHRLGTAVCPGTPRVADLAALLVACLPMFSFLHGVLNNDVLATTLATATTLELVRLATAERLARWPAVRLGLLLGLALLTKLTTLFLLPLLAVALVPPFARALAQDRL
ncbi:MAG: glycosyltransferase family 39 protein, partial [Planctomycetota bacterium]